MNICFNDAITISRASGVDLATVSQDLAKGYVGITKGLAKYNTGLTKAELSSKSFNEILGVLLKQSAGAANDYLGTTAYSMDVLGVATSNASEIIGGGLIDAFAAVGGALAAAGTGGGAVGGAVGADQPDRHDAGAGHQRQLQVADAGFAGAQPAEQRRVFGVVVQAVGGQTQAHDR